MSDPKGGVVRRECRGLRDGQAPTPPKDPRQGGGRNGRYTGGSGSPVTGARDRHGAAVTPGAHAMDAVDGHRRWLPPRNGRTV